MDDDAARIAAAIGEPARARMLYCLVDNRARTGTELAVVGEVSPSTASVHLSRLKTEGLVKVLVQGRHRYYSLEGPAVARVLEGLSIVAGGPAHRSSSRNTPDRLRAARTCYDHIAGTLGVLLHDRLEAEGWLSHSYGLTPAGIRGIEARSESTWKRREGSGAASLSRAWIGASGDRTWAGRWGRPCY